DREVGRFVVFGGNSPAAVNQVERLLRRGRVSRREPRDRADRKTCAAVSNDYIRAFATRRGGAVATAWRSVYCESPSETLCEARRSGRSGDSAPVPVGASAAPRRVACSGPAVIQI